MTQSADKNFCLSSFLPYRLSITSNAISQRIAVEYRAQFDLKVPEWRVMAVLGDVGPLTQRQLVGATFMDKVAADPKAATPEALKDLIG